MRKLFHVAIYDLRIFLGIPANLLFLLVVPIALTFVIGLANSGGGGGPTQIRVDVLDWDETALSAQFLDSVRAANTSLVLCPMDNDADDFCQIGDRSEFDAEWGVERVRNGDSLAFIQIPEGFESQIQAFEPVRIIYTSDENLTAPGFIRQAVDAALLRVNGAVVASRVGGNVLAESNLPDVDEAAIGMFEGAVYERAVSIWADNPIGVDYQLTTQTESEDSANTGLSAGLSQSVPGMGAMFVMFTVFGGMTTLVIERQQWTLPRLVMMPISRAQLLGGKILSRFLLGLLQFGVVFAFGLIMRVNFGNDPIAVILVIVAYTLAITALSFAVGNRVENEAQASGLSLLLSLVLASLGGAWWPLEVVPEAMRIVGHVSPVAWAMDGFSELVYRGGGLLDVLPFVLVLFVMSAVFFVYGVARFRYE